VFDLPVISPVSTEHGRYYKICWCGTKNKAAYPNHVNAPVQYGSAVETLVGYLHGRQYLPYYRHKELLKDCYRIDLSQGSIDNIIRRFAMKAAHVYQLLKNALSASAVIGSGETGAKVDGN
jgi:transposase